MSQNQSGSNQNNEIARLRAESQKIENQLREAEESKNYKYYGSIEEIDKNAYSQGRICPLNQILV